MKVFKVIFAIILFLLCADIFAAPYDMILVGEPVIEDIRFLSLESGYSINAFTPPFAPHEINNFLNLIDIDALSPPALKAYNRVKARLDPKTPLSLSWDIFSFSININATVEGRIRFNEEMDWQANPKIPSFISVPFKFNFLDTVQLYFDPAISIDPFDYETNGYFSSNLVFFGDNHINGNSPLKTFIAAGGSWWNFQLGRDRLSFGTGISGNLGIADNPPYYEFMRLSFFSNQFKYSLIVVQSPLRLTEEFYPELKNITEDALTKTTQRYFYQHRVDFTLFNVLSIALQEGVMIGNSALELRFLNPLMIVHNAMVWRDYFNWPETEDKQGTEGFMIGSFFTAEINWKIAKSISAYAQFAMTELAIGPEYGREDEPPNGVGILGGLQYSHSFEKWGALFYLECIYTFPYLYVLASPFASIIFMHNVGFTHEKMYYYYFGYPRDTFAITAGTRFFNNDTLIINGNFSWISKGGHGGAIVWDWKKNNEEAPSGIIENSFNLSIGAEWKVLSSLTLKGTVTGIYALNYNNINDSDKAGGQTSLSVTFHY